MAIKKDKKQILKNCVICNSSTVHNNDTYCKLRMKDDTIYTESAKVTQVDCIWYDERKNKNAK